GNNNSAATQFAWTYDNVVPTLSSSTPADNATGFAVNADIVLTFSENVVAGTGNITLYKSDATLVEAIDVTSGLVTISGTGVTINPTNDLDSSQGYYLHVDAAAIDDAVGNSYAGMSNSSTLNFISTDTVTPTLSSTSPADNATGVAVGANIVLTFNENVQAGSGDIKLYKSDNTLLEDLDVTSAAVTFSGATVTVNPAADLVSLTGYYVKVEATAIDDLTGNSYAGINDTTSLSFTAADVVAPTLSSSSPADNATGVAVTANIVLTFDENVQAGTGNITLFKSDNSTVQAIDVTSGAVTVSGTGVTINPTANLDSSQDYYLQIAATAIDDTSGNSYAGISDTTTLSFTAADVVSPILASTSPTDNATGVGVGSNIVLTFNENVAVGSGNVTLFKTDGTSVEAMAVGGARITVSGATVTVDPTNNLDSSQGYYLHVASTAIDDAASNSYAGVNDNTTFNFTAADSAGPTLSSSSPADDETSVAVGENIVLTFNENVVAGSGNITLFKSDNSTVEAMAVGGGNVSISGTAVTINPSADLDSSEGYYVQVAGTALDDSSGNSYAGISDTTTLSFTVADVAAPTLSSSAPADNATGVAGSANIVLTFNENIAVGSGNITLYKTNGTLIEAMDVTGSAITASTNTVTINPSSNLETLEGYYILIDATAIDDASGNSFAGIGNSSSLNFTAADLSAPTLTSSSPADGATGVAIGANITLTFNETVVVGSGNITLFKSDNTQVEAIAVGSGQVTLSSNTVTINPSSNLDSLQGYYVHVAAAAFDDASGNSYAGISDATTLNFTAADVAAPTLLSSSPADNAIGVAVDANIILTFNENVQVGSGNITLFKSDNTQIEAIAVGSGQVSVSGAAVTINPAADLDSSQGYYVQVAATAIDDTSGNSYAGISNVTTLNFLAVDNVDPTLASNSPADNATGVTPSANIVLTFSENVQVGTGNITLFKSDNTQVEAIDVTSGLVTVSTTAVTINPTTDLDSFQGYYLKVAATAIDDVSGNSYGGINDTTTLNFTTGDGQAPAVLITGPSGLTAVNGAFSATATFSENVTGFVAGDITAANGTVSNFSGSGSVYTFIVTPTGGAAVVVSVAGGVAQDAAANVNASSNNYSMTYDNAAPTIAITGPGTIATSAFDVTITFSESVATLIQSEVSITNGSITNFTGSGAVYTITVDPTIGSTVSVSVAGSVAQDAAGNLNTASNTFTVVDNVVPTMVITSTTSGVTTGSTTNDATIALTFTANEVTTDFVVGDIDVAGGTLSSFAATSSTVYTATFTPSGAGAT
ncbi:Ig-like domain-containing protein, partial [Candidatus Puniceispirillum sp.]|nr:Ig-like domain-containing protein [Candidatus Puniceispirillum sp.]